MRSTLGRKLRALRIRAGLRQSDLAAAAGVARGAVSRLERDQRGSVAIGSAERIAAALDARLTLDLAWSGAELDRLLDAGHAALAEWLAGRLRSAGWDARAEVSFNRYGDRGRYDLLAFHHATGMLLVAEIKTVIGDLQELLGRLDVKLRLAVGEGSKLQWRASAVVPLLLIAEGSTNRRRVRDHPNLFRRFAVRGASAVGWLRKPGSPASGVLLFHRLPTAHHAAPIPVQRVRRRHVRAQKADDASRRLLAS